MRLGSAPSNNTEFQLPDTIRQPPFDTGDRMFKRPQNTASPVRPNRFRLLTLDEIEQLPKQEWLIDRLLPAGGFAVLYGEYNVGKSFLALDWALSVAAGYPWLGRDVKKGGAVYVYAEGVSGLRQRAKAWELARGIKPDGFRAVPVSVAIATNQDRQDFVDAVRSAGIEPALIIIDTLARNFGGGDENRQQDMNQFVCGCDALREAFAGATVLVVHHTGKDQTRGARGSHVLPGAADAVLALTRSRHGVLYLRTEKQKDAAPADAIPLVLHEVQLPMDETSCVVERALFASRDEPIPARDPRPDRTDTVLLSALVKFGSDGARAKAWQEATAENVSRTAFFASLKRLTTAGKVRRDGNVYFVALETGSGSQPEQAEPREPELPQAN